MKEKSDPACLCQTNKCLYKNILCIKAQYISAVSYEWKDQSYIKPTLY